MAESYQFNNSLGRGTLSKTTASVRKAFFLNDHFYQINVRELWLGSFKTQLLYFTLESAKLTNTSFPISSATFLYEYLEHFSSAHSLPLAKLSENLTFLMWHSPQMELHLAVLQQCLVCLWGKTEVCFSVVPIPKSRPNLINCSSQQIWEITGI